MTRKLLALIVPVLFLTVVGTSSAITTTTESAQATLPTISTTPITSTSARLPLPNDEAASKLKQQIQILQEQKKTAITQIRDDARVAIQAKRDEFKAHLLLIKDEKRKALVEKIDTKLSDVNASQSARFTEILTRLQGFLDKINKTTAQPNVLAGIAAAQTAIDTAKTAVAAQAGKVYTMNIVDDTTLKANAGVTVSQFRLDIMAVYKLVVDAKIAVQKLFVESSLIKKEATSSAK